MTPDTTDLSAISRLLDQALDLPPADRERWLAALDPADRPLAPRLRALLAARDRLDSGFLGALPDLADVASDPGEFATASERIGPYRLLREIGRGGMGTVWLAERVDGAFRRQVALKLPRLAWGKGLAARMAREREIGARLEHPGIARLYDAGVDERGRPYLAFEHIVGVPIDQWCREQKLSVRQKLALVLQVARAVTYAHGRLVVHRDLKPSNVLVSSDGQAHLLDFGIAKLLGDAAGDETGLTREQGRVLTPEFASPEQLRGAPITVQSDVYGLGVLTWWLMTGRTPHRAKRPTIAALEEAILEAEPPPASSTVSDAATARALRGNLDAILAKALRRDPAQRYASADAFAGDIARHLGGERVLAQPDRIGDRLARWLRRHRVAAASGAAVLLAIALGGTIAVVQFDRAARASAREHEVKSFVADLFRASGAASAASAPRPLMQDSARQIEQRFAGQPALQAELYGIVSSAYADMCAYRLAGEFATHRIRALERAGAEPTVLARAHLTLAQALYDESRPDEARAEALVALPAGPRADTWLLLAQIELARGDLDAATRALDRAEALLGAVGEASVPRAWLLYERGQIAGHRNEFDRGLALSLQGVETALRAEGPLSRAAIVMRLWMANGLAVHRRPALTKELFDAAITAMHQLGGVATVRAALEEARHATRLRTTFSQITRAEAQATLERSRAELATTSLPIPDWYLAQIDFWRGRVLAQDGRYAEALALMEPATEPLRLALPGNNERRLVAQAFGRVLMAVGRHEEADRWLREELALQSASTRNHPLVVFAYNAIATNRMMAGRYDDAVAVLDSAPPIGVSPSSPVRRAFSMYLDWTRGEIELARGNAAKAARMLEREAPPDNDLDLNKQRFRTAFGEALCAIGRQREGRGMLESVLRERLDDALSEAAPEAGRLFALIGTCALAAGDRATAAREAARARQAFDRQPGVSPYFKRPVEALDAQLGGTQRRAG
ncbi:MAG TPA: protein kinase [Burkholderiaceae bacterium]|nr:protein kinase [Burkholderiaceae bacterium]